MRNAIPVRLGAVAASLIAGSVVLTALPATAVTGPAVASGDTTYAYTAQLVIGDHDRGCSGVLVDLQWVLTAGSCFVDNPASGSVPAAGPPAKSTTVTVGRTDLTTTAGPVTTVTELVPYQGRDLVMARLAQPATGITPVALSIAPPAVGETLKAVGFGRTKTEWSPLKQHTGTFVVDAVDSGSLAVTGQNGDAICAGDTGGPLVIERSGKAELIAVNSRSGQGGCWGTEDETRTGAVSTRIDDLSAWIQQVRSMPQQAQVTAGDFDGDGKTDVAALYDYGKDAQGRGQSSLWVFDSDGTAYRSPRVVWDSGAISWTWTSSKLTSGDYNGDGKDDVGVLYNNGQAGGKNQSKLWTFTSNGDTFQTPKVAWESGATSWSWDASKPVSGDFTGDGKDDVGILYNYGQTGGDYRSKLWTFTSNGDTFQTPKVVWDGTPWSWDASKPVAGDYNGDGRTDVGILYNNGLINGKYNSKLWTFTSNGDTFQTPKTAWDSGATSWNWNASQPVSGDTGGDGKDDLAVWYDYGTTTDGRTRQGLWNFTSTGTTMTAPHRDWDSALQ
ncbi:trypsin-like serine protease [Actinacidiphila glaucinigra]|uniref:trypsin-like serine protease n=1 Tax=Actinacidiphila glaucinigra TaxID=235986 RepID=UPI0036E1A9A2